MARQIQIFRHKPGVKITANGFYETSNDTYHEDLCANPSISSSGLVDMHNNPLKFFDKSIYNENRQEPKETDYFNFGIAAHELILEGDLHPEKYAVRPAHFKTWKGKDAQTWRRVRREEGMKVLTIEDLDNLEGMAEAIKRHPIASEIFKGGMAEATLIVKVGGIYVKARPDLIPFFNSLAINDYKTTSSTHPTALRYEIKKHSYDAKLANVAWSFSQLIPDFPEFEKLTFSLIFQEKTRPWSIYIQEIDPGLIMMRMAENLAAAMKFDECIATGDWPDQIINFDNKYSVSDYEMNQMMERLQTGDIPKIDNNFNATINGKPLEL